MRSCTFSHMSHALATKTWGYGDPPVVLLHGWIGSTADWDLVVDGLARDRRVLAYDHRGHGASPHGGPYDFASLVGDLATWMDAHDIASAHVVGHSMGGVVAMKYALEHPERVRSLVLVDTGAEPADALPMEVIEGLGELGRSAGMAALRDAVAGAVELSYEPKRPRDPARGGAGLLTMDPDAFVGFARELSSYESFVAELGRIACPTTVVLGEHDDALRPGCETIAAAVPGASLVVMEACGHSPQEDDPDGFVDVVRGHLA